MVKINVFLGFFIQYIILNIVCPVYYMKLETFSYLLGFFIILWNQFFYTTLKNYHPTCNNHIRVTLRISL